MVAESLLESLELSVLAVALVPLAAFIALAPFVALVAFAMGFALTPVRACPAAI
jgi:hypothetical protein